MRRNVGSKVNGEERRKRFRTRLQTTEKIVGGKEKRWVGIHLYIAALYSFSHRQTRWTVDWFFEEDQELHLAQTAGAIFSSTFPDFFSEKLFLHSPEVKSEHIAVCSSLHE